MGQAIAFYVIAAVILGFAVLVVTTRDTVHSVLFLVLDFLGVAALYTLLHAPFLAAIQILVYAGGIVVLYLFVVMLVNLRRPAEAHQRSARGGGKLGLGSRRCAAASWRRSRCSRRRSPRDRRRCRARRCRLSATPNRSAGCSIRAI